MKKFIFSKGGEKYFSPPFQKVGEKYFSPPFQKG